MLDLELQKQLRSLMPKPKSATRSSWAVGVTVASVSACLTFIFVLYIGEIHKLPLNSIMTRLDLVLARCKGSTSATVRKNAGRRAGRQYPSFTMAEQINAIEFRIDQLEAGNCFHDQHQARLINEIMPIKN
jgi:hypothetical protein